MTDILIGPAEPPTAEKFEAIAIGTGQSGPALATRMTKEGMKVAIIERKLFGGTCVNVGCISTKTLVASARAAYIARRVADFGVMVGEGGYRRHEKGKGAQGWRCSASGERKLAGARVYPIC